MPLALSEQQPVKASSPKQGDPTNLEDKVRCRREANTLSASFQKPNSSSFCGDSEGLLDRMLEQCQTRVTVPHPGFGRKLVPYFTDYDNDGSTDTTSRQKQRRYIKCPYHLHSLIPSSSETSTYSRNTQKTGQGYKRSPRSSKRTNYNGSRRNRKADSNGVTFVRQQDTKSGGSASPTATTSSTLSSSYEDYPPPLRFDSPPSLCALFAGPICFNSPPPEALPMPTAVLLAKAMCFS